MEWRLIKTAPKDDETEVLTWDGLSVRVAKFVYDNRWQSEGLPTFIPTHWMPLPDPPRGVETP